MSFALGSQYLAMEHWMCNGLWIPENLPLLG